MVKIMSVKLIPKKGQGRKEVTITFPSVTLTVQEFCELFNRIDEVIDSWYEHKKDEKLYRIIKDFLTLLEFPEGLPARYPDFFDAEVKEL